MNRELPDVQAGFRKGRGTRVQIAIHQTASSKKQEHSRKTSPSALLATQKPRLCGAQQTVENSYRWEYQTTLPASCEICMRVKKQQLELDMEQQTGSKLGK